MRQKRYTYIHTRGHGYLSVSIEEIKRLGIKNEVSGYSYMNLTRVYLEEDCDLRLFTEAKKKHEEEFDIVESYRDVSDLLPGGNYNPIYVDNPIQVGSIVENGNCTYKVIEISKKIKIQDIELDWRKFVVPKSNPYRYLSPKMTEAVA